MEHERCEQCCGAGVEYCGSCYEEGPDGIGHGPCPHCNGTGKEPNWRDAQGCAPVPADAISSEEAVRRVRGG